MKEKTSQRCARYTKNCWARVVGATAKSEKLARIKVLERQMQQQKRQFGVEYFELVQRSGTTDDELQACIQRAKNSISAIEQRIVELQIAVEQTDEATRRKIAKRNAKRSRPPTCRPQYPLPVATPVHESSPFECVPSEVYDGMFSGKENYVVIATAPVQPSAPSEEVLFGHSYNVTQ